MFEQLSSCMLRDRRARLEAEARAVRATRSASPPPTLRARVASARRDVGFRLVEAGLRLAIGGRDAGAR